METPEKLDDDDEAQTPRKAAVAAKLAEHAARKQTGAPTLEGCVNLGKAKQKAADLKWWIAGLHQIVLWIGTARGGAGERKGAGAAPAVAGARGGGKGQ